MNIEEILDEMKFAGHVLSCSQCKRNCVNAPKRRKHEHEIKNVGILLVHIHGRLYAFESRRRGLKPHKSSFVMLGEMVGKDGRWW